MLIILIVFIILIHKYQLKNIGIKSKENFEYIIKLIKYLFGILFSCAVIIQVLNFSRQEKQETITAYTDLSKDFLDDTTKIFIDNPDMNYFYMDLMGLQPISESTNRNIVKEIEIAMLIYSKFAKIAVFEEHTYSNMARRWVHDYLSKSFGSFMNSPTFRSYWPLYKEKLAGPAITSYMNFYYKI